MAVFTVSSLDRIKDIPTNLNPDQMQILGMGASKGSPEFPALPLAKEEIRAIVNDQVKGFSGIIKGKALLDMARRAFLGSPRRGAGPRAKTFVIRSFWRVQGTFVFF